VLGKTWFVVREGAAGNGSPIFLVKAFRRKDRKEKPQRAQRKDRN
jgi:hypothetical protein